MLLQDVVNRFGDDPRIRSALESMRGVIDDGSVNAVAQGWMRIGLAETGVMADALFVLTAERLGFAHIDAGTVTEWIPLRSVTALDAIEGTGYPLEVVELQISGGFAMLLGWPDNFVDCVVEALRATAGTAASDQDIHRLDPTTWIEPDVNEQPWATVADDRDVEVVSSSFVVVADDPVDLAEIPFAPDLDAEDLVGDPEPPIFAVGVEAPDGGADTLEAERRHESADRRSERADRRAEIADRRAEPAGDRAEPVDEDDASAAEPVDQEAAPVDAFDDFFEGGGHTTERGDRHAAFGEWAASVRWPEPFVGVVYLGGHPQHPRRRKRVTVALGPDGIAVGGGVSFDVDWTQVTALDVEGCDEVKFTHNHRIELNSSALIVGIETGGPVLFEIRDHRPSALRELLAPMVLRRR